MPQISIHSYNQAIQGKENINCLYWPQTKIPIGIKTTQNTSKNSQLSTQNFIESNDYLNPYFHQRQNRSKSKKSSLLTKNVSKKLFQKAKIVQNTKRKNFISYSPRDVEKNMRENSDKKIKFIQVLKSPKTKILTTQNPQLRITQGSITHLNFIQPQLSHQNQQNSKYIIDSQQNFHIKRNNIFKSSSGQNLLKNLIQERGNQCINKENQKDKDLLRKRQIQQSGKRFVFNLPKVLSVEVNDGSVIQNEYKNKNKVQKNEQNGNQALSSFSKLIIVDNYMARERKQSQMSDSINDNKQKLRGNFQDYMTLKQL